MSVGWVRGFAISVFVSVRLSGVDAEAVSQDREPRGCCVVSVLASSRVFTFEACLSIVC